MANLSDHDLKQMDDAWQGCQAEPVVRGLLKRALDDLRLARDRLNQTPGNSSRPSGSMPPWQRRAVAEAACLAPDQADTVDAGEGQGPGQPSAVVGATPEQQQPSAPAPAPTATAQPEAPVPKPASGAQVVAAAEPVKPAGRRVGAPGHGRTQKLLPTQTQEHRPLGCSACLRPLPQDGEAQAWTGWDTLELLPLNAAVGAASPELGVRIEVTRHLLMQQRCACGHTSQAQASRAAADDLWPGVHLSEQRLLGPRLAAAVVHLCVRMRLPRRKVSELLLEWFGLELSAALIDQTVHQAARSVAPLEQQLAAQLETAALVYVDETSWAEAGQALWLWVLCCCHTVLYVIGACTKEMFDNALSLGYGGTVMSDALMSYGAYRARVLRLRCWAHLHRKLRGVAESTDRPAAQGGGAMLQAFEGLMAAVFEARQRLAPQAGAGAGESAAPPAASHAQRVEQLRQLCQQHRDAPTPSTRRCARSRVNFSMIGL